MAINYVKIKIYKIICSIEPNKNILAKIKIYKIIYGLNEIWENIWNRSYRYIVPHFTSDNDDTCHHARTWRLILITHDKLCWWNQQIYIYINVYIWLEPSKRCMFWKSFKCSFGCKNQKRQQKNRILETMNKQKQKKSKWTFCLSKTQGKNQMRFRTGFRKRLQTVVWQVWKHFQTAVLKSLPHEFRNRFQSCVLEARTSTYMVLESLDVCNQLICKCYNKQWCWKRLQARFGNNSFGNDFFNQILILLNQKTKKRANDHFALWANRYFIKWMLILIKQKRNLSLK